MLSFDGSTLCTRLDGEVLKVWLRWIHHVGCPPTARRAKKQAYRVKALLLSRLSFQNMSSVLVCCFFIPVAFLVLDFKLAKGDLSLSNQQKPSV